MLKREFEELAIRGNDTISDLLFDSVNHFYMSDNNYHQSHGGADETKQNFVRRVFGGKVNTPKTICKKAFLESIKENTYCLQGCPSATKTRLDEMNLLISEQYAFEFSEHCNSEYYEMKKYLKRFI